jgi:predicted amidohydrolase YtcJ
MNSVALQHLDQAQATEWSEGGGEGSANRVLHGYAAFRADAQLQRTVDSTMIESFVQVQDNALAFGITSLQAMSYPLSEGAAAAALEASGPRLRWSFIRFPLNDAMLADAGNALRGPSAFISRGGVKFVLDGTPEERRMLLRTPYADSSGWNGQTYLTGERLQAAVDGTMRAGEQLAVHAVGDSAIALLFRAMRAGDEDGWPIRRVRVEHGDGMRPDLIREARALGVVVVQNPAHLTISELLTRRLGPSARVDFQPMRSLVEAGVPLALGSDGPMNPFLNIMFAVLHPANPPEALSVEEAVIAYTWGAAYAQFEETEKGTIAPGKLADLAVLSQDIFAVSPDQLPATTSLLTLVDGRIAFAAEPFGTR